MIRCYPIDGSEPFEVENDAMFTRWYLDGTCVTRAAESVAALGSIHEWEPACDTYPRTSCRIESWRERAERLEMELDQAVGDISMLYAAAEDEPEYARGLSDATKCIGKARGITQPPD